MSYEEHLQDCLNHCDKFDIESESCSEGCDPYICNFGYDHEKERLRVIAEHLKQKTTDLEIKAKIHKRDLKKILRDLFHLE